MSSAWSTRKYDVNDVEAGREYVKAYVEYIHFVERLHEAVTSGAAGHFAVQSIAHIPPPHLIHHR